MVSIRVVRARFLLWIWLLVGVFLCGCQSTDSLPTESALVPGVEKKTPLAVRVYDVSGRHFQHLNPIDTVEATVESILIDKDYEVATSEINAEILQAWEVNSSVWTGDGLEAGAQGRVATHAAVVVAEIVGLSVSPAPEPDGDPSLHRTTATVKIRIIEIGELRRMFLGESTFTRLHQGSVPDLELLELATLAALSPLRHAIRMVGPSPDGS